MKSAGVTTLIAEESCCVCSGEQSAIKASIFRDKQKTFVLVFDKDDDVLPLLLEFSEENNISSARLSGIAAFERVRLGYFDRDRSQ